MNCLDCIYCRQLPKPITLIKTRILTEKNETRVSQETWEAFCWCDLNKWFIKSDKETCKFFISREDFAYEQEMMEEDFAYEQEMMEEYKNE